jgi:hypothetical protein
MSLALAPAAYAQDATDFASKLGAIYGLVGYDLKFGPATSKDGTITYDGLSVTLGAGGDPSFSYKFDSKLTFTGVKSFPDGSYRADALTLPDMTFKVEDADISIKNISFNHIYASGAKTPSIVDLTQLVGDASVGPIAVNVKGAKAVTIDEVNFKNNFTPAQGDKALSAVNASSAANGITVDMSSATDPETIAQAKALGLMTVTGKAIETLAWSFNDGHMNASELSLGFDNVGKLKLAFDMTGYTPALLQGIMDAEKSLASSGTAGQSSDDTAKQTAMLLGALQSVFLNSASIRYDDASITTKLLDYNAKQQNITRDALINQIVTGAPTAMSEGQSSSTPDQMTLLSQAALRAFLNDPHSIEVRLAPKSPLGVLGLVGAAMAPDSLVDQIGLEVLVNDKQITAEDAAAEGKLDAAAAASAPAAPADTTTSSDTTTPSDTTDTTATATPDASPDTSGDAAATASDGGTDKLSVTHFHSN